MSIYVVTGAAGFIGSHLADALLAQGHDVRALDDFSTGRIENLDPRCKVITADVADRRAVSHAMHGADGCFHLAAIASVVRANKDWLGTHHTNQTGTVTVLDAARACGGLPVVYASSAAVYGDVGNKVASEDIAPAPMTAYGADKLGSELHARVAFLVHGVPTFGLRFFNVYGPRQDPASPYSGVISIFARAAARRTPMTVHGDGGQMRDFIYVSDVVAHLLAAMTALHAGPSASAMNVCTGVGTGIRTLATLLGEIAGWVPDIRNGAARPGDIRKSLGDPALASRVLNLRAQVGLRDGLSITMAALAAADRSHSALHGADQEIAGLVCPDQRLPEELSTVPEWFTRRVRVS